LMGRVSAVVQTVMGAPRSVSLAVGATLVAVLDYHIIFAIMAAFTSAGVAYLLICLRGQLFRPDPPFPVLAVQGDEHRELTRKGT